MGTRFRQSEDSGPIVKPIYIVVLVLLAAAAGGVWWTRGEPVPVGEMYAADKSYTLQCNSCLGESPVTGPEAAKLKKDKKTGMLQCPKCSKFTSFYGQPKAAQKVDQPVNGVVMP